MRLHPQNGRPRRPRARGSKIPERRRRAGVSVPVSNVRPPVWPKPRPVRFAERREPEAGSVGARPSSGATPTELAPTTALRGQVVGLIPGATPPRARAGSVDVLRVWVRRGPERARGSPRPLSKKPRGRGARRLSSNELRRVQFSGARGPTRGRKGRADWVSSQSRKRPRTSHSSGRSIRGNSRPLICREFARG